MPESQPSPIRFELVHQQKVLALTSTAGQWLRCHLRDGRKAFGVPSQSTPGLYYLVDLRTCTCPDARVRGVPCKHVAAVRLHVARIRAEQARRKVVAAA